MITNEVLGVVGELPLAAAARVPVKEIITVVKPTFDKGDKIVLYTAGFSFLFLAGIVMYSILKEDKEKIA